ncbi:1-aminocyclopropane-1-carboxylate oxidase homolog 4-like [Castanea sativa]|uniref:1-aminocyclopropane-1-carboxylate oxidase homolog 4-like n=1 Tax=Castanea sativa TaxID=21020 RepID=UPI003F6524B0
MAAAADHATPTYDRMKEVKEFDESKIGVKGLAESGITSIPRMFIHSPETLSDLKKPNSQTCTKKNIPLIDLSHFNSPTKRHQLVEQIRDATSTWGFFQVINHGIPKPVLDETINAIKAFHDQPHEVKSKLYNRDNGKQGVVYSSNYDLYRAKAASWHDSLLVWMAPEAPRAKEEDIPEVCRKEIVAWESHSTKVAEALLELLSEGLGVEAERFKNLGFLEGKLVVGHCYPYCPQPDLTVGITSHTDSGLTVLLQNQVGGLQVKHGDEWVDVEPIPGALTVNIGDFIQIISNDNYISVEHRVLAKASKEARISILTFFNVGTIADSNYFGPLPELLSPDKPALYRKFTMPEFYENFNSKGLDSKSFVKKVRL